MSKKEVIAMHGWGSDSSRWLPWMHIFNLDGWVWKSAERGYGDLLPTMPNWTKRLEDKTQKRVLICHSLGSHLINKTILEKAEFIILLSSFSRFIPKGKENRSIKIALEGMHDALGTEKERPMLENFFQKAHKTESSESLKSNSIINKISIEGRERLKNDLKMLFHLHNLPLGFPTRANVLVINASNDSIITPSTKATLIKDLSNHLEFPPTIWEVIDGGHTLSNHNLINKIKNWLK